MFFFFIFIKPDQSDIFLKRAVNRKLVTKRFICYADPKTVLFPYRHILVEYLIRYFFVECELGNN